MTLVPGLVLQNQVKAIIASFVHIRDEGLDIYNLYWKGGVQGTIGTMGSNDPTSYATRLTKSQLVSGLTLADQLGNIFFENSAVTQGDYMATCQTVLYGSANPVVLTTAVEAYANKLVAYAKACVQLFDDCRNCENFYGAVLFSAIAALSTGSTQVTGADMTKDQILAAIALIHQFQMFITNQAVTADYYKTTLGLWAQF